MVGGSGWVLVAAIAESVDANAHDVDRTYVATCRDGRAELVASVGADGVRSELGHAWSDGPDARLEALAGELSRATWYHGRNAAPGTPFPAPFARNTWNDGPTTAYAAAPCDDLCGDQLLVLGPCRSGADGGVWSTAPLAPMPRMALPVRELRAPRADGDAPTEVMRLVDPSGASLTVFDEADGRLATGPTTWQMVRGPGVDRVIGIVDAIDDAGTAIVTVIAVEGRRDGAGVTIAHVEVDGRGC